MCVVVLLTIICNLSFVFFFSSRRRHTRFKCDWSSDVCSSDLGSIVGTNVAADALSNLASPGVIGGALIVVGEDYGEGASIIQERAHAYALKSSLWLIDPRPNPPAIVRCTEKAFGLSEATNTPVMMELRIRACHVT